MSDKPVYKGKGHTLHLTQKGKDFLATTRQAEQPDECAAQFKAWKKLKGELFPDCISPWQAWKAGWNANSPVRESSWQPIDTAPRDGTEILLYVPTLFQIPYVVGSVNKHGTVWLIYDDGMENHGSATTQDATHWMPLTKTTSIEGL